MDEWRTLLFEFWGYLVAGLHFATMTLAAGHAVIYKRDYRATTGWVGLICLVPFLGAGLYWLLGINRIFRRAEVLRSRRDAWDCPEEPGECDAARVPQVLAAHANHFRPMTRLVAQLTGRALL
ncbi:MAG: cardiolipin synthase, partial [Planctomycetota bacterium]